MKKSTFFSIGLLLISGYLSMQVSRCEATPFYQGKTIEIMGESRVGGGTDTMARIIASVIPQYIPGNPNIIVRSMPGAAGAIANNIFYANGKPDGLHLMMNSGSPIALQLRSRDIVKYDLTKLEHIGHVSRGSNLLLIRKEALKRLNDPKADPVVCATKEGEENWMAMTLWGREFLGWNIRWLLGYSGTSDIELAFQRGEVDMFATSNAFIIKRLRDSGLIDIITQQGVYKNKKYSRRPDFPEVPTFVEVLGKKQPTGIAWQAYRAWVATVEIDKFLVAPRNTPKSYVTILRNAFEKMGKDPKFDQMIRRMVTDIYEVGVGKDTSASLNDVLSVPQAVLDYGRGLQMKFDVTAAKK